MNTSDEMLQIFIFKKQVEKTHIIQTSGKVAYPLWVIQGDKS